MKNKLSHINTIGSCIQYLVDSYAAGQVKGVMIHILNKDGTFENGKAGEITYLEKLGLLESAKGDFIVIPMENVQ